MLLTTSLVLDTAHAKRVAREVLSWTVVCASSRLHLHSHAPLFNMPSKAFYEEVCTQSSCARISDVSYACH